MNTPMEKVEVKLPGRAYWIEIGSGTLGRLGSRLRELISAKRVTLIADQNVGPLHAARLIKSLESSNFQVADITVPGGESSKSLEQARLIYDELAGLSHGRHDPMIALGGGVVGDLSGFVAATWMRGVPFVQCPTTLEADIDAGVGGKTAVNHASGKNMIGVFYQPSLVWIDVDCLCTLNDRDYRAGLAESVKHAVIFDEAFLQWHEEHVDAITAREPRIVQELVRRNCEIKAAVVVEDEKEAASKGVGRAALNFGHTVGHAIEAVSEYELRHGEAVSLGMVAALDLAVRHCHFPDRERQRIESLLSALGLPVRSARPLDASALFARMRSDKKAKHQTIRFVLPSRIGNVAWFEAPAEESVADAIDRVIGA